MIDVERAFASRLDGPDKAINWGRRPVGGGGRSCPRRVVAAPISHRSHRMWPAGRLSSHGRETGGTGRDKSPKIRGAAGDAVHLGTHVHVWCGEPGRPSAPTPELKLPSPRGSAVTGCTLAASQPVRYVAPALVQCQFLQGNSQDGPATGGRAGRRGEGGAAGNASACTGCAAQLRHACHLELCDASEVHCLLAPT